MEILLRRGDSKVFPEIVRGDIGPLDIDGEEVGLELFIKGQPDGTGIGILPEIAFQEIEAIVVDILAGAAGQFPEVGVNLKGSDLVEHSVNRLLG